jgi:hypothetical protein
MDQVLDLNSASQWICKEIKTKTDGWAAGKIGTSELNAIRWFLQRQQSSHKTNYPQSIVREMKQNAGFWNGLNVLIDDALDDWAKQTLNSLGLLDAVVSWSPTTLSQEMELLNYYSPTSKKIVLRALEPYYTPSNQYTLQMTEGKIAVVSPFAKSIQSQWLKMSSIFPLEGAAGQMWLPNQEIIAINSFYGPFMTPMNISLSWSPEIRNEGPNAAIDYLENEVIKSGAKYAFVGIGALSLILVARLKKHGITAIHTGGGTQIMFGVKGKRWSNHTVISNFFNSNWISPLPEEIPSGANNVEGGCYW